MSQDEKRSYFRISGTIYLHAELKEVATEGPLLPQSDKMDEVSIRLMHYKARLCYNEPAEYEYFLQLAEIIEAMQHQQRNIRQKKAPLELVKQSVIISGSGMEFFSTENWKKDDSLILTISFLEYPFATITTEALVMGEKTDLDSKRNKTAVSFQGISEKDRELIIKFVNHLQRKKILANS